MKKEVNIGALNHPLEMTLDPISLSVIYTKFRKHSLGISLVLKVRKSALLQEGTAWSPKKAPDYCDTGHQWIQLINRNNLG